MLHISLLVMNRPNKTKFAIYISLKQSLLPKDLTIQNLFYGDLVYKLRKIVSRADFSDQLEKLSTLQTYWI